jgi:hypothetical protein
VSRPPIYLILVAAAAAAALLLLAGWLPTAAADKLEIRSQYEERLINAALARRGLTRADIHPLPEGKIIEAIDIDAGQVILPGDLPLSGRLPWTFLNRFHARTRDWVIAQELLFHVGDPFHADVFEESGRNLRTLFILAVARLVVVRGADSDHVRVLVITKDQWSLRLNMSFELDQVRVDTLSFQFAEMNVAGRNKRISLDFGLDPGRYNVGSSYTDVRILRSRHEAKLVGAFYINRQSGALEGGQLLLTVGRPLFSLRTRFGWQAQFQYLQDIVRYFSGGDIYMQQILGQSVPDVFNRLNIIGTLQATYSLGIVNKVNLSFGYRAQRLLYTLPANFPTTISDDARRAYQGLLPRSEDMSAPYIQLDAFTARFIRLKNIQTLALSEDIRLGPEVTAELRLASPLFGLPSRLFEFAATYTDQRYLADDLLNFGAAVSGRLQSGVYPGTGLVNETLSAYLRNISPRFGPLRLHVYAQINLRAHDIDHRRLTLGSDNGLRGYAPREFQGPNLYQVNVELRSIALNLWTIHVGGVLFYDAGDAPSGFNSYDQSGVFHPGGYHQDAGVGLRLMFPQFNRDPIRLDLAFPFETDPATAAWAPRFSASFGQAF